MGPGMPCLPGGPCSPMGPIGPMGPDCPEPISKDAVNYVIYLVKEKKTMENTSMGAFFVFVYFRRQ
jgi:hypothetical protein